MSDEGIVYPQPDVTIVVVFQDSMPWLRVLLECFKRYKNDAKIRYVFVQNMPQKDSGPDHVHAFVEQLDMHCWKHTIMQTWPPPCADGRAHAHGLSCGYPAVLSEWTMFIDADAGPLCDHWLDYMLSLKCPLTGKPADMVGPVPDSGIEDYKLPVCHPSFLLFRTKLAKSPYWTEENSKVGIPMYFGSWGKGHTPDGADCWDVCRPFSYQVAQHPEVTQVRFHNHYSNAEPSGIPYWRIGGIVHGGDQEKRIAYHIREASKRWARGQGGPNKSRWELIKEIPELSWVLEMDLGIKSEEI